MALPLGVGFLGARPIPSRRMLSQHLLCSKGPLNLSSSEDVTTVFFSSCYLDSREVDDRHQLGSSVTTTRNVCAEPRSSPTQIRRSPVALNLAPLDNVNVSIPL